MDGLIGYDEFGSNFDEATTMQDSYDALPMRNGEITTSDGTPLSSVDASTYFDVMESAVTSIISSSFDMPQSSGGDLLEKITSLQVPQSMPGNASVPSLAEKEKTGEVGMIDKMVSIYKGLGEHGQGFAWKFLQGAMMSGTAKKQTKAMQMNAEANMMAAKTRQQELDNKIHQQGSAARAWANVPKLGISQFAQKLPQPAGPTGLISGG